MSFWKRIFKQKNSTAKHEVLSLPSSNYCTSCGLGLLSGMGNICPQCGHDQRAPIAKKITNPNEMAHVAVSFGWSMGMDNDKYIDDLVNGYGTCIDQPKKNELHNVFLFSDLAITTIIYFTHHTDNPKQDKIVKCFKEALEDSLLHAYGKEEFQVVRSCLASMLEEYSEAFAEKDGLQSVSKVLQYHAESVILILPILEKEFALPSIHAFMKYFVHVSSFLPPLKAMLNKWEVE